MIPFELDIAHIVELGTQLASSGAIKALELAGGSTFEYIVGVAVVIYEQDPG